MLDKNTLKELKTLIALCKKEGVKSVEVGTIKLEFNPYSSERKTRRKKVSDSDPVVELPYSDDDALFWSADGMING